MLSGEACVDSVCTSYPSSLDGLKYFWRFQDQSLVDSIASVEMTVGKEIDTTSSLNIDHNIVTNGSVRLGGGYLRIPSGDYFENSQFTIAFWVRPSAENAKNARILEFGNGKLSKNIILTINYNSGDNYYPGFYILNDATNKIEIHSDTELYYASWSFLVVTCTSTDINMFINGELVATQSLTFAPVTGTRTANYVGSSSWGQILTKLHLDDLRIYNRALSQEEIVDLQKF